MRSVVSVSRLVLTLALCLALIQPPLHAARDTLLPALKVAYIYNFTRFIRWPTVSPSRPFVIGVIGDSAVEAQLRVLEREERHVDDRPIQIRRYTSPETITACEILFVGAEAEPQLAAIAERTAEQPTLLVGDTEGYARQGVAIELFLKQDIFGKAERLRFRINRHALIGHGLWVSAQLYDVAEVVN